MYPHTENEATSLRHSNIEHELKQVRKYVSRSEARIKVSKASNYFERYRNRYIDQAPSIFDQ